MNEGKIEWSERLILRFWRGDAQHAEAAKKFTPDQSAAP